MLVCTLAVSKQPQNMMNLCARTSEHTVCARTIELYIFKPLMHVTSNNVPLHVHGPYFTTPKLYLTYLIFWTVHC